MPTRLVAIGGSDAGISAALRARELDPTAEVIVVLADAYPNFSICGIPYYVSGEVADWHNLAHRTIADLEATGMTLQLDTVARRIDPAAHRVTLALPDGREESIEYDALIIGTGTLQNRQARRAVIVGAGSIGLEMAEALTTTGLAVTQVEQLPEVLPTVDPELGALVHAELRRREVNVLCSTRVDAIETASPGGPHRIDVHATGPDDQLLRLHADLVLVSVGV